MKKMQLKKNEQGFTIIELVVVILLLGILTATALPRFMDVTDEAHAAAVDAVEGGLATGLALYRAQWFADRQPASVPEFSGVFSGANGWPIGNVPTTASGFNRVNAFGETPADGVTDCVSIFNGLLQDSGRPELATILPTDTLVLANFVRDETSNRFSGFDGTDGNLLDATADYNVVFDSALQTYSEAATADFVDGLWDPTGVQDPGDEIPTADPGDNDNLTGAAYCTSIGGDWNDGLAPGAPPAGCDVNGNGTYDDTAAVLANAGYCDYIYTGQYQDNNIGDIPVLRYTPSNGRIERLDYTLTP